ncbi:MAG TPA: T9SS type A sorting domain-containing protein [Chitinophagales bacterium]|nr:T9SS type A sorting domain-containing protein [Chitinophagales bacterium]
MSSKHFLHLFLALFATNVFATHYMAADITYKVTGNFIIEATITTYSRMTGFGNADKDLVSIYWGDGTSDNIERSNGVDGDGNGYKDGEFIMVNPETIKKSIYTAVHTYPGAAPPPNNFYVIEFMDLNRIDGINNIQNGASIEVPLFITDTIFTASLSTGNNSSPVFLNPAVCYANLNDAFTFNLLAHDADGDSISFEMITPLQGPGSQVPVYSKPGQYCQANGSQNNSFELNPKTGQITWVTPCRLGIYNIAVKVNEYRCGIRLSTVMSDLQIIVLNLPNDPPVLSPLADIFITAGDSISFPVSATDANSSQTVSLEAKGGAFIDNLHAPVFQSTSGNPATGLFTWQTAAQSARDNAYIFSVIAKDNYEQPSNPPNPTPLSTYQTFRVWVTDNSQCDFTYTGIAEPESALNVMVYPNPVSNEIEISTGGLSVSKISIYTTTGQLVSIVNSPINNIINVNELSNGVYLLRLELTGYNRENVVRRFVKM